MVKQAIPFDQYLDLLERREADTDLSSRLDLEKLEKQFKLNKDPLDEGEINSLPSEIRSQLDRIPFQLSGIYIKLALYESSPSEKRVDFRRAEKQVQKAIKLYRQRQHRKNPQYEKRLVEITNFLYAEQEERCHS
ncbi:hypothetical protein KY332_01260 [Candidatus Woesearchaeota archaeon]|nr:hypothetical protein [Candidatus Woesearchaeota archaeon]